MKKFYLYFVSAANSSYARQAPFRIQIECNDIKDAKLIGERMRGEPSWEFSHAQAVEEDSQAQD